MALDLFALNRPLLVLDALGLATTIPGICGVPDYAFDCKCFAGWPVGTKHKGSPGVPDEIKEPDGCSAPPFLGNDPSGVCSFEACCNDHDCQYGICNFGKADADDNFYDCMKDACDACGLGIIDKLYCKAWAYIYYAAVFVGGVDPYDENQEKVCETCCCPD